MHDFNYEVATKLREISCLLEEQHANPFRFQAYLNAAKTLENLPQDIRELAELRGIDGLVELPTIGIGIARSIFEYIAMGRMSRLADLRGSSDPVRCFQMIPTVGSKLAQRIHEDLHVDSFEALANAAEHGSLDKVKGIGYRRKQAIKTWLFKHFGRGKHHQSVERNFDYEPSIKLLLKVDSEYRNKAKDGSLPLITPEEFNPDKSTWLPVLHTKHEDWHFTVRYSNSQRAHKLKRVFDWVIIYFYDNYHQEGQRTVVTETRGSLAGKRVVRGREKECKKLYH